MTAKKSPRPNHKGPYPAHYKIKDIKWAQRTVAMAVLRATHSVLLTGKHNDGGKQ